MLYKLYKLPPHPSCLPLRRFSTSLGSGALSAIGFPTYPVPQTSLRNSLLSLSLIPQYPPTTVEDLATFRFLEAANTAAVREASKWSGLKVDELKDMIHMKDDRGFACIDLGTVRFVVERIWPVYYRRPRGVRKSRAGGEYDGAQAQEINGEEEEGWDAGGIGGKWTKRLSW